MDLSSKNNTEAQYLSKKTCHFVIDFFNVERERERERETHPDT